MNTVIDTLKKQGWILYLDSTNCGYCQKQLLFLGSYLRDLNVVHCDNSKNKEKCKKCNALPCWEKNGKIVKGARLSVDALQRMIDENV